eukprot:evm.model.scf_721.2 EVM.evm.TU.scf_721.2   scf_721:29626-33016(-)
MGATIEDFVSWRLASCLLEAPHPALEDTIADLLAIASEGGTVPRLQPAAVLWKALKLIVLNARVEADVIDEGSVSLASELWPLYEDSANQELQLNVRVQAALQHVSHMLPDRRAFEGIVKRLLPHSPNGLGSGAEVHESWRLAAASKQQMLLKNFDKACRLWESCDTATIGAQAQLENVVDAVLDEFPRANVLELLRRKIESTMVSIRPSLLNLVKDKQQSLEAAGFSTTTLNVQAEAHDMLQKASCVRATSGPNIAKIGSTSRADDSLDFDGGPGTVVASEMLKASARSKGCDEKGALEETATIAAMADEYLCDSVTEGKRTVPASIVQDGSQDGQHGITNRNSTANIACPSELPEQGSKDRCPDMSNVQLLEGKELGDQERQKYPARLMAPVGAANEDSCTQMGNDEQALSNVNADTMPTVSLSQFFEESPGSQNWILTQTAPETAFDDNSHMRKDTQCDTDAEAVQQTPVAGCGRAHAIGEFMQQSTRIVADRGTELASLPLSGTRDWEAASHQADAHSKRRDGGLAAVTEDVVHIAVGKCGTGMSSLRAEEHASCTHKAALQIVNERRTPNSFKCSEQQDPKRVRMRLQPAVSVHTTDRSTQLSCQPQGMKALESPSRVNVGIGKNSVLASKEPCVARHAGTRLVTIEEVIVKAVLQGKKVPTIVPKDFHQRALRASRIVNRIKRNRRRQERERSKPPCEDQGRLDRGQACDCPEIALPRNYAFGECTGNPGSRKERGTPGNTVHSSCGNKGLKEAAEGHRIRSRSALQPRVDSADEQLDDENRVDRPDWQCCASAAVTAGRQPSVALRGTRMNVAVTEVAHAVRPFRACIEDASNMASASCDTTCPRDTQAQELSFAQWGSDAAINGTDGYAHPCASLMQPVNAGDAGM